jgi:hypothetical protein
MSTGPSNEVGGEPLSGANAPFKPKSNYPPLTRNQKIRDFLIGFLGWYLVTALVWYLVDWDNMMSTQAAGALPFIFMGLNFSANLIALIVLSVVKRTRYIGFGILVALALNLLITTVLGEFGNGLCFFPFWEK